ncbi:MAG: prephenate dehydrogenase/arogenate dehydrogenase family protein [Verrucomicrobiota bacterium]
MKSYSRIAIFGPGLMGGSLCLALRERFPDTHLAVWGRSQDRLSEIQDRDFADSTSTSPSEIAKTSELIIFCTPVERIAGLIEDCLEDISSDCLVTDVGSVKSCVDQSVSPLLKGRAKWIGSHPMTGSEKSGIDAARADLYQNARTLITPTSETDPAVVEEITEFWSSLGAIVYQLSPEKHDQAVAVISHLPHLLASTLVQATPESFHTFAGPGYRDTTRIAAGSPELWQGILLENRQAVLIALQMFINELGTIRNLLQEKDSAGLETFLREAAESRCQLKLVSASSDPETTEGS